MLAVTVFCSASAWAQGRAYNKSVHVENSEQVRVRIDNRSYVTYEGPRAAEIAAELRPALEQHSAELDVELRKIERDHAQDRSASERNREVATLLLSKIDARTEQTRTAIEQYLAAQKGPGHALLTASGGVVTVVNDGRSVGPALGLSMSFAPWSLKGLTHDIHVPFGVAVQWFQRSTHELTTAPDGTTLRRYALSLNSVFVRPSVELLVRRFSPWEFAVKPGWSVQIDCHSGDCSTSYRGTNLNLLGWYDFSSCAVICPGLGVDLGYQKLLSEKLIFNPLVPQVAHSLVRTFNANVYLLWTLEFLR